jgi:RecJ-like exonuclease
MIPPVIGCVPCRGIGVVAANGLRTCERCSGRGYHVAWPNTERATAVQHEKPPAKSLWAALADLLAERLRFRGRK